MKTVEIRSGNTRFGADDTGREYATFKEHIAAQLPGLQGKLAQVTEDIERDD